MRSGGKNWLGKADAAARLGVSEAEIDRLVGEKQLKTETRRAGNRETTSIDPESIARVEQDTLEQYEDGARALVRVQEPRDLSPRATRNAGMEAALLTFLQSLVPPISSPQTSSHGVPIERRIFLTVAESAELSGLPAGFLRRLMREGKLKAIRAGAGWRIPRAELESLAGKLTEAAVKPTDLSDAEARDLEMNRLRRRGMLPPLERPQ